MGGGGARAGAAGLSLQKSVNITTVNQLLFGGVCVCVWGGGGARAGAAGLSLKKSGSNHNSSKRAAV